MSQAFDTEALRSWMRRRGVSRARLAAMCGLPYSTVQNLLRGKSDPGLWTLRAIHEGTGMPYCTLIRKGGGGDGRR